MPEESVGKLPPGTIVGGPVVEAKLRETYAVFGILYAGSIAAVLWTVTQGIGWTEIAVFAGMFALTTFGIGAGMHRLFVHRSFRSGPMMRAFLVRSPRCRCRARSQMGLQSSPASSLRRRRRRSAQPFN